MGFLLLTPVHAAACGWVFRVGTEESDRGGSYLILEIFADDGRTAEESLDAFCARTQPVRVTGGTCNPFDQRDGCPDDVLALALVRFLEPETDVLLTGEARNRAGLALACLMAGKATRMEHEAVRWHYRALALLPLTIPVCSTALPPTR